eukprot:13801245-Heterocapsa_arctica.AAC.1
MRSKSTNRIKEGHVRDHRELYIGTLGRDVSSSEIQELYLSEEGRQDVRLHDKYVKERAKNAEQTGEGQIIQQGQS